MRKELSTREREVALAMIAHATTSPDEVDWATFTPEQKEGWDEPVPITGSQRGLWAANLDTVVVSDQCKCGTCPSVQFAPRDQEAEFDRDASSNRIVLDAGDTEHMVLLYIDDDVPTELELAPIHEGRQYSEFPPADTMTF